MSFSSLLPQDKALHSVAAPAPGPSRVQAQRRYEGVPGGRPITADPDGAPPLSAGPQATEGPPSGPALHPEAGQGRCDHQGLCQIHSETSDCHRGEKGQVTEDERVVGPPPCSCSLHHRRLPPCEQTSLRCFRFKEQAINGRRCEIFRGSEKEGISLWRFRTWITVGLEFLSKREL